ncbi:ribonuclease J [Lyngbya confervoides]|uniref:Ribonuclease J n=1 Tax=Lyngbya confervoides BDU141951 TaxID=1574623 RepID=A0ABD4T1K5_9CYAN|nr:ribonuclease J [Lyngbya confervoides]MCM1982320.1 ribonuclease J [Lyngbya confervoides BDU141951]
MSRKKASQALKIIPLGGLHEIGKNTCVFEYGDEIILLDAGLAFPSDGMHGVNIVLPDMTYLRENRHKIKGMIVTHGHEDHIGGIPFHLKQFDIPVIYGPRLAMALLQRKLEEAGVAGKTELRTVAPRDIVRLGENFFVEYIRNTHSISDSFSVALHTPLGVVIHTGDFKIDHTPVDGERFDFQKLAEHGEQGVLCLISDSTNSEVPGFTPAERSVFPNLDRVIGEAPGRVFLTTFASSVHRVNMVLELAQKHGRKVSVLGRSMLNVIAHARELGYIKCPDNLFEPLHALRDLPDHKILILSTGSQGEPMAAMSRIARGEHRQVRIRENDTVIFSANPIPGNTIAVVNLIDALMMKGARVVYGRQQGLHVSGHGSQEDQKMMIGLTRPKFFLPVHGEHRMLVRHAKTAQSMGIPAENMVVIQNGDIVELTESSIQIAGQVSAGIELMDNAGVLKAHVLEERQRLAEDGIVTVAVGINGEGKLMYPPQVHLRGVVTPVAEEKWQFWVQSTLELALNNRWSHYASGSAIDWEGLQDYLEREIQGLLRRELKSRATLVLMMQSSESVNASQKKARVRQRRTRSTAQVAS